MMEDKGIEVCKCHFIHKDAVQDIADKMTADEICQRLAEFYKAFADATRIKILSALMCRELCVCDLAYLLKLTQPAVSYQLKILKNMKLVKFRKDGKVVYFSLIDDHIKEVFKSALDHISE